MIKKIFISGLFLSLVFAQGYDLDECIQIALDGKKTLMSAELGVSSAERG